MASIMSPLTVRQTSQRSILKSSLSEARRRSTSNEVHCRTTSPGERYLHLGRWRGNYWASPKYPMTQSKVQQLARILSRSLPVDTEVATYVRAYYAGDGRVPDWEQRLAAVVAHSRVLSSS